MKNFIFFLLFSLTAFTQDNFKSIDELTSIQEVKNEILKIAIHFKGQGDPDYKIQNFLKPYVEKLIILNPQEEIQSRQSLLVGSWQQVWGPYEYRKKGRGIDPSTDVDNIYQVVFNDGYYYNIGNVLNKKKKVKSVTILRGEYTFKGDNKLQVHFTKLKKIKGKLPSKYKYIQLPELSESKQLPEEKFSLPNFFVKWFFGGGTLTEVYTDKDLRLAYGSDEKNLGKGYLYVMKRVK